MIRHAAVLALLALASFGLAAPGTALGAENCEAEPRPACFGIESVEASLSSTDEGVEANQAGAHPDLTLNVAVKQNPSSPANVFGLHNSYAATRDIRIDIPPGLIGDPNAIGAVQQCSEQRLLSYSEPGGGCPNGSQIGVSNITAYELQKEFLEPVYMMTPPGGDVVARVGLIAGVFPTFINFRVRSESDYGITAEIANAPALARLIKTESTFWGIPAASAHDEERCTAKEAFNGCATSPPRPPGGKELPFFTNPTRCGVPLSVGVNASSWAEPEMKPEGEVKAAFPEIQGCNSLPFGPSLEADPTSHHTSTPTGLAMTLKLPASIGVKVLEPSQARYMRIDLPRGFAVNTDSADGLGTCSAKEVRFGENAASECPDAAKLAATEFDIPVLERNLRGAIYLREQEPGHPYRIWIVADDLGLHVKLPGELELDKETGQIHSIVVGTPETEGIPQAPLREVKLLFKSGFRAPLITPSSCDAEPSTPQLDPYLIHYEFTPWSGGPVAVGNAPMEITEGCESAGFSPRLSAGSTDSQGGAFSPFITTIVRADSEQNIAGLSIALPRGLAASFAGLPHCEGEAAETGACPPESRIGKVVAAVGAGPAPLWVPQPGKRPTAVYLGGPYKGAPTSIVAVVPKQAGPFDFGDEVVRSAVFVDPVSAQATAQADPLPQFVEGTPLFYKTISVQLDRPNFVLNPTSCAKKQTIATLTSTLGSSANATSSYAATDCSRLGFAPSLSLRLSSGRHAAFPKLQARLTMPRGGANIASSAVIFPRSEFVENNHFLDICTKVQFSKNECPANSVYGVARATTPLIDGALEGPVYLRSTTEPDKYELPDVVAALKGPPSLPIEVDLIGHVDSAVRHVHGEKVHLLRTTFSSAPDAPVNEFTLEMQGGDKGLFVNSQDLCEGPRRRFTAAFTGQNGKQTTLRPVLQVRCPKHRQPRSAARAK
jgi:hypothetical protein